MCKGLSDFYCSKKQMKEIRKAIDYFAHPEFYEVKGIEPFRGIVITGDKGTGRTMLMECLAKELGAEIPAEGELYKITPIMGDKVNYFTHFLIAEDVDQHMEGYLRNRIRDEEENDDWKYERCFVIVTSNEKTNVSDDLLLKNGVYQEIHLDIPQSEEEKQYYPAIMLREKILSDIPEDQLIRMVSGMSQKEFVQTIKMAGILAACEGREVISERELLEAMVRISGQVVGPASRENIAIHEAGHVLIGEAMMEGSVAFALDMEVGTSNHGFTRMCQLPEEEYEKAMYHLHVLLGSSLAYQICCRPNRDMGNSDDLDKAYLIARNMVTNCCTLGLSLHSLGNLDSEELKAQQEKAICKMLQRIEETDREIIENNLPLLKEIVRVMMEKEYITSEDIARLRKQFPIQPWGYRKKVAV